MAKTIAVSSGKGGVCKTSSVINFACLMAQQGKRVLIVDTDSQGNVSLSFGKQPDAAERSLIHVLTKGIDPKDAIMPIMENLDLLPSNDEMAFLEFNVLTNVKKFPNPFILLKRALEPLKDEYDYIFIDTPPNLGLTQGNVLAFADSVIIPFQPEGYSMRSLMKTLEAIFDFKKKHNPRLTVEGVMGVLVDNRTTLHEQILERAAQYCSVNKIPFFSRSIPRSIRQANAIAYKNKPIVIAEPYAPVSLAYKSIWKEIEDHGRETTAEEVGR